MTGLKGDGDGMDSYDMVIRAYHLCNTNGSDGLSFREALDCEVRIIKLIVRSPPWCRGERWTCDPRVRGSIPGASNLKKLLTWMKIHGLPQKS